MVDSISKSFDRTPQEIMNLLDECVIGQTDAKKTLIVAILQHLIRINNRDNENFEKNNVLMIGNTGCGKSYLIEVLKKLIDIPITHIDISGVTTSGWHGENIEDVLIRHIDNCLTSYGEGLSTEEEKQRFKTYVETGIIYLDEIDKLRINFEYSGFDHGEKVQQQLLKVLEKGKVNLQTTTNKTHLPLSWYSIMDTRDLLIICGGAFVGLEDYVRQKNAKYNNIGFATELDIEEKEEESLGDLLEEEDLIDYGFCPEFIGRLSLICTLHPLEEEHLVKIMKESKNSILLYYKSLFNRFSVKLEFEDDALLEIAKIALAKATGARSLKGIIGKLLLDYQYNICNYEMGDTITVTVNDVKKRFNIV